MDNVVQYRVTDGIARITLNRPNSLNAFDGALAEGWTEATTDAVSRDDVRAVLIEATGRAFCAGGDLRAIAALPDRRRDLEALAARINVGIQALVESSIPVVAAAHGTTAGGGLGILLSSDYAIIGTSSKVGSLYSGVGLTPDLSVSALLARAVGERRALQLVLQERMLSADEALDWGIAAEVVADDAVVARAEAVAAQWASGASNAYGQAKRLLRSQPTRGFAEQLAEEARTIGEASVADEGERLIRVFISK